MPKRAFTVNVQCALANASRTDARANRLCNIKSNQWRHAHNLVFKVFVANEFAQCLYSPNSKFVHVLTFVSWYNGVLPLSAAAHAVCYHFAVCTAFCYRHSFGSSCGWCAFHCACNNGTQYPINLCVSCLVSDIYLHFYDGSSVQNTKS